MPGPPVVPVHGDTTLPDKVDVVVIGGGIVGASIALELAERKLKVALCEKGGIGQEQSSRNWGWVRMTDRDPREVALMAEALRLWPELNARTGRNTGYVRSGTVFADAGEEGVAKREAWFEHLKPYRLSPVILDRTGMARLFPGNKFGIARAVYSPFDGTAEPQLATSAIAEAARERGAAILAPCAVRGFETVGGRAGIVFTERGPIRCDAVVLAGGVWSNLMARRHGIDLPQLDVASTVLRTGPLSGGPEQTLTTTEFAFRRRQDGGYTVGGYSEHCVDIVPNSFRYARRFLRASGTQKLKYRFGTRFFRDLLMARPWAMDQLSPFEKNRVLDPVPMKGQEAVLSRLGEAYPVFKTAEIVQTWAGYIDVTPDVLPVISAVDAVPGFYIATGFSGHGFGLGPAAGVLMADLVTGNRPAVDPQPYRHSRFSDGSRVRAIPSQFATRDTEA